MNCLYLAYRNKPSVGVKNLLTTSRIGATLIEIAVVLIITSFALAGGANVYSKYLREQTNQTAANHFKAVVDAYDRFLQDNSGDVISLARKNNNVFNNINTAELIDKGYLSRTFLGDGALSPFGQNYVFYSKFHESANGRGYLESFVYTASNRSLSIRKSDVVSVIKKMGVGGAFVKDNNEVQYGYSDINFDPIEIGAKPGSFVSAMRYSESNSMVSDFLYRNDVGNPALNTMNTDLHMGNNNVDGVRDVVASGTVWTQNIRTAGSATIDGETVSKGRLTADDFLHLNNPIVVKDSSCAGSPNGLVGSDAKGSILSCQNGVWRSGFSVSGNVLFGPNVKVGFNSTTINRKDLLGSTNDLAICAINRAAYDEYHSSCEVYIENGNWFQHARKGRKSTIWCQAVCLKG